MSGALLSRERLTAAMASHRAVLVLLLVAQVIVFSITGSNFASRYNAFLTLHLGLEVCLLAIALTPVIVTGGIDLSVGSLLGLCAVLFGKLWRDAGWPIGWATIGTLGVGAAAGMLNGLLVTRLRIPPLIVTLGTFSLFRGVAEGVTLGADSFTGFPGGFLELSQGYIGWDIPAQLILLPIVAGAFWVLLHRAAIGRSLVAIGYSPDGARYAGIPVDRRVALVYVLAGTVAGLAAVVYVGRVGEARANAGMGYELSAITAVVLGGTSIFGGRGSILGTIIGWLVIAVLQQGLRLSDRPTELAGVFTGVLLIGAIAINQVLAKVVSRFGSEVAETEQTRKIEPPSKETTR
jgi:rhamnose transport system permease protein